MSSVSSQILENFKTNKEYRHAFVEEKVRTWIAAQIRAIREHRQIKRPELARMMSKAPSWVFRLEDPNLPPPTISTLLQVAEAFDVDLNIEFGSFSDLVYRLDRTTPESFEVPSFEEELKEGALDMGFTNSVTYDANNYMDAAFAPVQLANKIAIHKATWGHLAPRKNRLYRGHIVFTISAYGDMVMIDADWGDLPDSPWLFDAMHDFVFGDESLTHGAIYRFDGTFRNYKFEGARTVLYAPKVEAA